MLQLLFNILISFSIYLLIAQSFTFIYYLTKFFHIAHAIVITISAYLFYLFFIQLHIYLWLSIILSIGITVSLALLFELLVFKNLRKRGADPLVLMITSIGLYIVFQNLVSMIWGDDIKSLRTGITMAGNEFLGAYITNIQITTIVICLLLFIGGALYIKYSKIGRAFRGISSNIELSNILGIDSNKLILILFGIASFFAAVVGLLVGFDSDLTPTMGFNLLLYGMVAMIIGGVGTTWGLIGGALLLASAQHFGAYFIDSKWIDAIAYIILILFLFWKPLGFSGKRLKKVEI